MENNADYFIKLFDILLNEKNYPVVLSCFLGKDRAAIASALILLALGVNDDVILDDFLISNDLIDYRSLFWNADAYNYDIQEAITALYSAHKETLEGTLKAIELNYGSVDNYLEKELHLNHKKREKLKSILLY
jgi:protein-tyrosine phosphatase